MNTMQRLNQRVQQVRWPFLYALGVLDALIVFGIIVRLAR